MKRLLLLFTFQLVTSWAFSQDLITIKGTVLSSVDNSALPGVSIYEKGSTRGTMSSANGEFTLSVSPGSTIVFSAIGAETLERSFSQSVTDLKILMNDRESTNLSEVVVTTALGIKKEKRALGFATQDIQGESMVKAREPQVVSSLTGRVAGLTIYNKSTLFETASITLRGKTPLLVIDGVPTQGDLWNLNPDDIENINVLKSNAAALLYGSLGVNGALEITTKKGKKGIGMEVSLNMGIQSSAGFLKLPETQKEYGMGWDGWYAFVDGNGGGGWYDNYGYVWGPKLNVADPTTPSGYTEYPQYNSPYDPDQLFEFTQNGYTGTSHYKPMPWISRGEDNLKNFLRNELLNNMKLSVASRGELGGYRVSFTNLYQQGQIPNTSLNSSTFAVSGNAEVSKKINLEGSISYNKQMSPNYPVTGYSPDNFFYNILLWMGPDVDIMDLKDYWKSSGGRMSGGQFKPYGVQDISQVTYNYAWYNNPWFMANERLRIYKNDIVVAGANLTYDIFDDLSLKFRSGGTFSSSQSEEKFPYSYINYSALPYGGYNLGASNRLLFQNDILLTYKKNISDLSIVAAAGGANRYENYGGISSAVVGGLQVPLVYNLKMSRDPITSSNSKWEKEVNSVFGYTDLGFKNYLNLNISVRNDWSSTLRKPYNSYFYPSASLGFVLSDLIDMPAAINYFKLRAAYADVKSDVGAYYTVPSYSSGTRWNGIPSVSMPGSIIDQAIKPSRTISREVGFESQFFKNKIGLDVTYYSYLDKDSPRFISLSPASGYSSYVVNGDIYNRRGLEVVLTATPVKTKDFKWNTMINYSRVRNYIKELYGGVESRGLLQVGDRINVDPGRWGDFIYSGWVWEKSPDGQIVHENGLPKFVNQSVRLGVHEPDWDFGISNNFSYKNFTFGFLFDGRIGGVMFNGVESKMYEGGMHPATANSFRDEAYLGEATYISKGVVVTSGSITYDAFGKVVSDTRQFAPNETPVNYIDWVFATYTNGITEALEYKQNFVKLREITVGYDLKPALLKKTPFRAASISLVGRNLFLFTKVPFMDPEAYSGLSMAEPTYRNIGLNLNLQF